MNNIFLITNILKLILFCIIILILFLYNNKIIKSKLLDFITEIYDYSIPYNSFLRFVLRFAIVLMVLSILFFILFLFGINNKHFSIINKKNDQSNRYENLYHTNEFRNLEYIGGVKVYDSYNKFDRWIDLYIDLDTKEILKGVNASNYITAGLPIVNTDKMIVPSERKTFKGFQEYVLNWTGSILYDNYDNDNELVFMKYGNSKSVENYNKPIDVLCDINWNSSGEYKSNAKYQISTISEIKNNSINGILLESNGKLNGIEYIYSVLRNCFSFISDDFYSLGLNNILFNQININDLKIGDIGIKEKDGKIYQIGMCIGFDKRNNPVFTICDDKKHKIPEYTKFAKKLKEMNVSGYNILHVEPKDFFNHYVWQNRVFDKYYKTNLPFDHTIEINDNVYDLKGYANKISDDMIEKYNNQVYSCICFNKYNKYMDMTNKLYYERVRRIKDRENKAKNYCGKYNIDINQYTNMKIDSFDIVYNTDTFEYMNFINHYNDEDIEYYKQKYKKKTQVEKYQEEYNRDKEFFINKLTDDKNDLKELTIEEIYKYYENKGIILKQEGKKIIEEFYNNINNSIE